MDITSTKGYGTGTTTGLVSGPTGAGKTYLARTCPGRTLIISAEAGLLSLRDVAIDVKEIGSIADLKEAWAYLHKGGHGYEWVYIDSLSEIAERSLFEWSEYEERQDKPNGMRAYGNMAKQMIGLTKAFRDLPYNVWFSAQQSREDCDDGIPRMAATVPGKMFQQKLPYLFDEVLVMHVGRDDNGKPVRWLQTDRDQNYDAKDRSGALNLQEPADLGIIHRKIMGKPAAPSADNTTNDEEQ